MSQNALNVVKDKYGNTMKPGSLYTYTETGGFWQTWTMGRSKDAAGVFWQTWTMGRSKDAQQARIYYVPADVLVYRYLDPKTNHVWFDVDERKHSTYGSIKSCSLTIEDVAKYVIPAHRNCIRHPGRILNASTDHLTVGNQITVNPNYACICLLQSTAVSATRYLLNDTHEIYVTESDKDHFSIKFRNGLHYQNIDNIFTMNAHLFVTKKNGGIELQFAQICEQYKTELQRIKSKSSEAIEQIQNQMANDCNSAFTNMQERVMSIAGNELKAKQLEVDELKKQLAKTEQDRQRRNDGNGQSLNDGSEDSDEAWGAVMDLAFSSEQSSNGGNNGSAAQPAARDTILFYVNNKWMGCKTPSVIYNFEKKRMLVELKRHHCKRFGLEQHKMRLLFKGRVVFDTQTLDDLEMQTGESIDAMTCDEYLETAAFGKELKSLKEPYGSRGKDVELATTSNGGSQKRERNNDDDPSGASHQKQVKREERGN